MNSVGTRVGIELGGHGGRWIRSSAQLNSAASHLAATKKRLLLTWLLLRYCSLGCCSHSFSAQFIAAQVLLLTSYSTPFLWLSTIYRAMC